jgi:hypothetical protein
MTRIPFTLPDVGLREIRGSVYLTESFLILELEDALLGEWDKDVKTIEIEPAALVEIWLDRRLFRDRLVLRPTSRTLLDAVPGNHVREMSMQVWRWHRGDVSRLISEVRNRQPGDGRHSAAKSV